jgi:hypothetical protein
VSIDEKHMAFPKLLGAPAYARPPAPVVAIDRPFDPDELPLMVDLTPEERALADALVSRSGSLHLAFAAGVAYAPGERAGSDSSAPDESLTARPFSLRGFTSRIRGRS